MKYLLTLCVSFVLFAGGGTQAASSFTTGANQIAISVAPGFNHLPVRVNVSSNAPTFNIRELQATSDAGWVTAAVDPDASQIVLQFATSNLVNQSYTATILTRQGQSTNSIFVNARVAALKIARLVDDPVRSRVYGVQIDGLERGAVVIFEPITGTPVGNLTVGKKPTDLAVTADGNQLFVINSVDQNISVIDLKRLEINQTIPLPTFDNWGANDTTADLAIGPKGLIYYSDGAWAPVLRVLDPASGKILQTLNIDSNGFGDFAITSDGKALVAWAQYGWSAGWAGSYLARFTLDPSGLLTLAETTDANYPTPLGRDPLDSPVLITRDDQQVFVKQWAVNSASLKPVLHSFPTPVFSISPGGEIAATATAIYQTETGIKLLDLPTSSSVQVMTSDYARLVYFDPAARLLKTINLLAAVGPELLNRKIAPAPGSIVLAPDRLTWPPLPGVDQYRVYFGLSEAEVTSAGTNSPLLQAAVNAAEYFLKTPLTPGTTYYWRVDAVRSSEVAAGDVQHFTVSTISASVAEVNVTTIQGFNSFHTAIRVSSSAAGQPWQVSSSVPWISFGATNGLTPADLDLVLDASHLPVGLTNAAVSVSSGSNTLFTLPVKLRVEALHLNVLKSDPSSDLVFGVTEDTTGAAAQAYLVQINTTTESIDRMVPVGSGVTDLALHNGDQRIYAPNWRAGSLVAVDKSTFQVVRSFAVPPFGGVGYSRDDVYRVSAGAPGRLVVEGEDQWVSVSIFDTSTGQVLATMNQREGGGAFEPGGRYYYHGDNNSSGAAIYKFDVIGDHFSNPLASIRVESGGYYGSRVVVVAEKGNRVFWNGSAFNADLAEEWTIRDIIYACSTDGRYAFGQDKIYDVSQKQVVLGMPASTAVSAFNTTTRKLVVQAGGSLGFFPLTEPPSLPKTSLTVLSLTINAATLGWTDKALETGFTLQKRLASSSVWENAATPPQNTNQWTVTGLAPLTTYHFRIKAEAPGGSSEWSDLLAVTTPGMPPGPIFLNSPKATLTSVLLTWNDPTNEDAIVLERRLASADAWSVLKLFPANTTNYVDSTVVSGSTYQYRVAATNQWGASSYSQQSVTVPLPSPPAAPTMLDARAAARDQIEVTWTSVDEAQSYRLERRQDWPQIWTPLGTFPANQPTRYVDTNVLVATEYWYRVFAVNSLGDSKPSPVDSAIPLETGCILSDTFDPAPNPSVWAEISGGQAVYGSNGFAGSKALWFGTNMLRSAVTVPVPISSGASVEFRLRAGNQEADGSSYWDNSETNESVVLEFTLDGFAWTQLQLFNTVYPALSTWNSYSVAVPNAAASPHTQFRWRQLKHSGAGFDTWALKDVCIRTPLPDTIGAPPFLLASGHSATSVVLFWFASPGAASYLVERKAESQSWTQIGITSSEQTYFTDTDLMPARTYAYRVRAAVATLESAYSSVVYATTLSQVDGWLASNFGDSSVPITAVGLDGVPYIIRFAFNLDAVQPLAVIGQAGPDQGVPRIWLDDSRERLSVEFIRRKASTNPGISYAVQFSNELADWSTAPSPTSVTNVDAIWERVRFEDSQDHRTNQIRFGRVTVHRNPGS